MGGNIFDNVSPIKKEYIDHTLGYFRYHLNSIFNEQFQGAFEKLGSTGKKDVSGDIDLGYNFNSFMFINKLERYNICEDCYNEKLKEIVKRARTATLEQCKMRAFVCMMSKKINKLYEQNNTLIFCEESPQNSTLHCKFPIFILNRYENDYVQIDLNFGDIEWLKFAYYSESYEGNIKGLHRTQLMLALFDYAGYTFSHNYGVKNKVYQQIVATTPEQAINILNDFYKTRDFTLKNLSNYYDLFDKINTLNCADKIFDIYLKILDSTRCDIPENLQDYWIQNKNRLGLSGKSLSYDTKLWEHI